MSSLVKPNIPFPLLVFTFLVIVLSGAALPVHLSGDQPQNYVPETDPLVLKKLEQWQDKKFGLLMHWGPYSQWGIVESWSICPEDYGWCQRKKEGAPASYFEYVKAYEKLKETFNPRKFNPRKWAEAAWAAGMKYVVFTTKHHDGFCMFDSKYTRYKVTDRECPFSTSERANITREIFNAFRAKGFWTGAYFSKPDWHCDHYWWRYFPPRDRNVNYDPALYPEKWQKYVSFTHDQILEILTGYGRVDILWLDGGWVARQSGENLLRFYAREMTRLDSGFIKRTIVNQDIKMDDLVRKARKKQPGLIVVDRAVKGKHQNYLTPENRVPDQALPYPWESCIIAGGGWSYVPGAKFLSGHQAVQMLVDIVCKGGNLLLNIAPAPDGTWPEAAYELLRQIGEWLQVNGEAVYATRAVEPYKEKKICYTSKNNGKTVYAVYLPDEKETRVPPFIVLESFELPENGRVSLLGNGKSLPWKPKAGGMVIEIPSDLQNNPPCRYAWCLKLEKVRKSR